MDPKQRGERLLRDFPGIEVLRECHHAPHYAQQAFFGQEGLVRVRQTYAYRAVEAVIPRWHYPEMDNMARLREAKGLTQTQLAEAVGANQATISKIESGVGNPTLDMINRIAKALSVSPAHLFTREALEQRAIDALSNLHDPREQEAAVIVLESMAARRR